MKVDQESSHSYVLLEWKIRIPECFGVKNLQLIKDISARVIHLTPQAMPSAIILGPQDETHTLVTIGAGSTQAMGSLTPNQILTDNYYIGAGYKKLHTFLGYSQCQRGKKNINLGWHSQYRQLKNGMY